MRKVSLLAASFLVASVALAQGTYTQIDVPGAFYTNVLGINSPGDIVGAYQDSSGNVDGFLLSGGTYTTIDYFGSKWTYLTSINDDGQIVGYGYLPTVGFLYNLQTQDFTVILPPKGTYAFPAVINNNQEIGGLFGYGTTRTGFVLSGSQYSVVSPPHAIDAAVFGITANGTPLGSASNGHQLFYFTYSQGKYSDFSIRNAPDYRIYGANPQGTAFVGLYEPSLGVTAGFVYQNRTLTTLQFPGSSLTVAYAINMAGEVVGAFEDTSGNDHGFTWVP
jgi:probable HAF family extracellular repeat protein